MPNPRPVLGAVGGLALAAALVTVASAQTSPATGGQDPQSPSAQGTSGKQTSPRDTDPVSDPNRVRDDRSPSSDKGHKKGDRSSQGTSATSATTPGGAGILQTPLRLRAVAVDPNQTGTAAAGTFEIVIERWSSDAEVDKLESVLREQGGGDALLRAVQRIKPRAGFVRTTQSLGWDIQFAHQSTMAEGVRRILIGTDRPMSFWEATNRPRSADYDFLVAEIRIDKDGRGEGRLVPAAMVDYDEGTKTIEVENFQAQPVRLTEVRIVK